MFGGMGVFGTITTTDMSTGETLAQVNPTVPHFDALFADTSANAEFFGFFQVVTNAHEWWAPFSTRLSES